MSGRKIQLNNKEYYLTQYSSFGFLCTSLVIVSVNEENINKCFFFFFEGLNFISKDVVVFISFCANQELVNNSHW